MSSEILLPRYDPVFHLLSSTKNKNQPVQKRHMLVDKQSENVHIHICGADINDYATEYDIRAVENFARHDCDGTVTIMYKTGQLHLIGIRCKISENEISSKIQSYILQEMMKSNKILPVKYNRRSRDFVITVSNNSVDSYIPPISHKNNIALPDIYLDSPQDGDTF